MKASQQGGAGFLLDLYYDTSNERAAAPNCSGVFFCGQTGPTGPNTCSFLLFHLEFLFNTELISWQLAGASIYFPYSAVIRHLHILGHNLCTFTRHVT